MSLASGMGARFAWAAFVPDSTAPSWIVGHTARQDRLRGPIGAATQGRGAGMGDKGGKKDKEKNHQQQVKKTHDKEQQKLDKSRPSVSAPPARGATGQGGVERRP